MSKNTKVLRWGVIGAIALIVNKLAGGKIKGQQLNDAPSAEPAR